MNQNSIVTDLTVASLMLLTATAFASEKITPQFTSGDSYPTDFTIPKCEYLRGFGKFHYDTFAGITVLSDFCIDEQNGIITSAESRSGFQLVSKTRSGRAFEILNSGRDQYTRIRLSLSDSSVWFSDCNADGMHMLEYNVPDKRLNNFDQYDYARAVGYTIPDTSPKPMQGKTSSAYFSLRDFSQAGLKSKTAAEINLPEGADFIGELSFNDTTGDFIIVEGLGNWAGDGSGSIQMKVDSSGTVLGSGKFITSSSRLAGHEPNEWVNMSAEVTHIRGHILGEDGRLLSAYGLVNGSYVDASGKEHKFHASAQIEACFDESKN